MLLKFLLISGLVIFLMFRFAKYILRFAFWLLGWQLKREMKRHQQSSQEVPKREGSVEITYAPDSRPGRHRDFTEGEYIDFEEIK